MSAPLSHHQKARLSLLSDQAFNLAAAQARGRGEFPATTSRDRDQFRHDQVACVVGKAGLTCCGQENYRELEAHFLSLLGEAGRALNSLILGQTDPRRIAEYKLRKACAQFGFSLNYAEAICRRQNHGAGLADVGAKTLWHLTYTVLARGRARKKSITHQPHQPPTSN
jgi:hypothetical protein